LGGGDTPISSISAAGIVPAVCMGIVCSMSILIVDDEPQIRALLADILTEEGYTVDTATNGQDAINYLQTTGVPPCMIVLDLMMPIMDGWQFRAIQQHDPTLAQIR